jgi:hemoglobin-like flavoprotein
MILNVKLLRESFELVVHREPDLTHRFYDNLFRLYPQARSIFGQNNRAQQEKVLASVLASVIEHLDDAPWLEEQLGAIGERHLPYGVDGETYAWIGDALITTLAHVAGPDWNHDLSTEWMAAYGAVSSFVQHGARRAERAVAAA